jgi:hypothetical protein
VQSIIERPGLSIATNGYATAMASADSFGSLKPKVSPAKALELSPRAIWLYLMRLDELWASCSLAHSRPAPCLSASSFSYGREFVFRSFILRLTASNLR